MKRWLILPISLLLLTAVMLHFGLWRFNYPKQTVVGVDVSHYQGTIDWPTLVGNGIDFAYIKATEGSSFTDERFGDNLRGAMDIGLPVGAYHFFSYDSPGRTQAEHFIETVPDLPGMLPPAIDVEFYGAYEKNPAPAETAVREIRAMADALCAHYGRPPVIYATERSYRLYILQWFDDCSLWIRNVYWAPREDWTIWQYTDRGRLSGYAGDTPYIDMNVVLGDRASLDVWAGVSQNEE